MSKTYPSEVSLDVLLSHISTTQLRLINPDVIVTISCEFLHHDSMRGVAFLL